MDVTSDAWPEMVGDSAELLILNGSGVVTALRLDGRDAQTRSVGHVEHEQAATVDASWVVVARTGRVFAVPAFSDAPTRTAWLEENREAPFGIVCRNARCLVARRGQVASVYMADPRPRLHPVHRTSRPHEPVDFIVRFGDQVLVVDEDLGGAPEATLFGWAGARMSSPELRLADGEQITALATEGDVLWLLQGREEDASQRIRRCVLRQRRFVCTDRLEGPERPWIGEQTPLSGIAPVGRRAFVCAGRRGVLSVPMRGRVTRLRRTEFCRSVARRGERIYAIVDRGRVLSVRNLQGRETSRVRIGGMTVLSGGPVGFAGP